MIIPISIRLKLIDVKIIRLRFHFILLILIFLSCKDRAESIETNNGILQYYSTGELKHAISIRDSLLDGPSLTYYKSGELKYEKNYVNNIQVGHQYYYSKEGKLQAYNFYDSRGNAKYQVFTDTLNVQYKDEGKLLYIKGEFKETYKVNDTITLIPSIANPFKSKYIITCFHRNKIIKKEYDYGEKTSPLFQLILEEGNNELKFKGEIYESNNLSYSEDSLIFNMQAIN